jgi:hypothetical protein
VWLVAGARLLAPAAAGAVAAGVGVWAALLSGTVLLLGPVALLWVSPVRRLKVMPGTTTAPPEQTSRALQEGGVTDAHLAERTAA